MEDEISNNILKRKMQNEAYYEAKKMKINLETENYENLNSKGHWEFNGKGTFGLFENFLRKKSSQQFDLIPLEDDHADDYIISGKPGKMREELITTNSSFISEFNTHDGTCVPYTATSIFNGVTANADSNELRLIYNLPAIINSHNYFTKNVIYGSTSVIYDSSSLSQGLEGLSEEGKVYFIFDKNMDYENKNVLRALNLHPTESFDFEKMSPFLEEEFEIGKEASTREVLKPQSSVAGKNVKIVETDQQFICKINIPSSLILPKLATFGSYLPRFKAVIFNDNIAIKLCNVKFDISGECFEPEIAREIPDLSLCDSKIEEFNSFDVNDLISDYENPIHRKNDLKVDENDNYIAVCENGDLHVETEFEDSSEKMLAFGSENGVKLTAYDEDRVIKTANRHIEDIGTENMLCEKMKALRLSPHVLRKKPEIKNPFKKTQELNGCTTKILGKIEFSSNSNEKLQNDSIPLTDAAPVQNIGFGKPRFSFKHLDIAGGLKQSLKSWGEQFQDLRQYLQHDPAPANTVRNEAEMGPINISCHYFAAPDENKPLADQTNREEPMTESVGDVFENDQGNICSEDHIVPSGDSHCSEKEKYFKSIRVGLSRKHKVASSLHPYLNGSRKRFF